MIGDVYQFICYCLIPLDPCPPIKFLILSFTREFILYSIKQSRRRFVCLSVRLSETFKISVTAKPIEFYSSENIPTGVVVVLGYFLRGWDPPLNFFFVFLQIKTNDFIQEGDFCIPLGAKPLKARCEAFNPLIQYLNLYGYIIYVRPVLTILREALFAGFMLFHRQIEYLIFIFFSQVFGCFLCLYF